MNKEDKLTYEDLKLGEKAKEAFFKNESPEKISKEYPVYLNTRDVGYYGLNGTDLAIAAVLGGLNSLYVGDTGTGKSQLAQDIHNYYFGGSKTAGGNAVKIKGKPDLDIYEEVYRDLIIKEGKWVPNENVRALMHFIDELNRCPPFPQNQFFGLGDGHLEHKGMNLPLGKEGYSVAVATANLGNGEFSGTFDTDKALYNRFAVSLDFDYDQFKPTREDRILIDLLRAANPKVKDAPIRDISGKIIMTEKEIGESSRDLGVEASAALNYLKFGLENCFNENVGSKEKIWPKACQDCNLNNDGKTLCSLIRSPLPRTIQSIRKYAIALDYLAKLKNPKVNPDAVDTIFKAFDVTGAYQWLLNPMVLRQDYSEQNPKMMKEVVERLKDDFKKNEDFIVTSLELARQGKSHDDYFEKDGNVGIGYSKLSKKAKDEVQKINPFNDKREIGLTWVNEQASLEKLIFEKVKNKTK